MAFSGAVLRWALTTRWLCGLAVLAVCGVARATSAPAQAPPRYWISIELWGSAAARADALQQLSFGLEPLRPRGTPPRGALLGALPTLTQVLAWIGRTSFGDPQNAPSPDPHALRQLPAPVVGGRLFTEHDLVVGEFYVMGATAAGDEHPIQWPDAPDDIVPENSGWVGADLIPERAPLFAAPGPQVPPAHERYAMAFRHGALYVLDFLDRCSDERAADCLRWAQVIARDGNRFVAGYLPAMHVAIRSRWVHVANKRLPRALLIRSGVVRNQAVFEFVARGTDSVLRRRALTAPMVDGRFPPATLTIDGDDAVIGFESLEPVRIPLDASLDARPPSSSDQSQQRSPAPQP